jgi:type II secretory pathway predicted ATPase ExeA
MYAEFFGLRELPFNNTPDPRFFYSTPDHEEALASLIYAVKEKKGFVLLTGEVGAGKTLVSRLMLKHFAGTIAFANVNHAIRDSGDLIESMCAEFELPCNREDSNAQRVRTLHDFLLARFAQNVPVVLVLDEAQNLSVDAFEQLRMIGNLEADDAKLLQIVIVGQPELQTLFQSAILRQLRQRLFRSFHLPALDGPSVDGYIRHRLTVAGARDAGFFGSAGAALIHRASRGLPRLINTLCDNAMLSAYSAGRTHLDTDFLETVLASFAVIERDRVKSAPAALAPSRGADAPPARPLPPRPTETPRIVERAGETQTRLEEALVRGTQVLHELSAGADRAIRTHEQFQAREQQLTTLVHAVKACAARIAPLLADLQDAARRGTQTVSEARETGHQLELQQAKAQATLARLDDRIHQTRLAGLDSPAILRSVPDARVSPLRPAASVPKPAPAVPVPSPMESLLHCSSKDKAAIVQPELEALVNGMPPSALRLAHRMESLAALVQDAVAACAPRP